MCELKIRIFLILEIVVYHMKNFYFEPNVYESPGNWGREKTQAQAVYFEFPHGVRIRLIC